MRSQEDRPRGWDVFYDVVRRIPRGRVATYGQIAALAGRPRSARQAGFAMAALHEGARGAPWQRVLGARGGWAVITIADAFGASDQRRRLEREGVAFDERGRVSLARYGWAPRETVLAPPRRSRS